MYMNYIYNFISEDERNIDFMKAGLMIQWSSNGILNNDLMTQRYVNYDHEENIELIDALHIQLLGSSLLKLYHDFQPKVNVAKSFPRIFAVLPRANPSHKYLGWEQPWVDARPIAWFSWSITPWYTNITMENPHAING